MRVRNVHERELNASREEVGRLIDSLASPADALWPRRAWPRMEFDRALGVGATGGHGPIRYFVEAYSPGRSIRFRFTGPRGFEGYHAFDVVESPERAVMLRHTLEMMTRDLAFLSWPIVFRPLHDALIEDSLSTAEASLGLPADFRRWSRRVRCLRWLVSRGRAREQELAR